MNQRPNEGSLLAQEPPKIAFCLNDFQFIEKIGSGKFGQVLKAIEKRSKQFVAIKKVKKELLDKYDFYS